MPAPVSNVVQVNITRNTLSVAQAAFNVALILGVNLQSASRVNFFGPADIASGNLANQLIGGTSAPEYIKAAAYFAQNPCPSQVAIGVMLVTTTASFGSNALTGGSISVTIGGQTFTQAYVPSSGQTAWTNTLTALQNQVNAVFNAVFEFLLGPMVGELQPISISVTPTSASGPLPLIVNVANAIAGTISSPTYSYTGGIETVLVALQACQLSNPSWYGVVLALASPTNQNWKDLAAFCQSTPMKICAIATNDPAAINVAAATDIGYGAASLPSTGNSTGSEISLAAYMNVMGYTKTIVIYSDDESGAADAALFGAILWRTPGSYTAMFKQLAGIATDNLSATQEVNAHGTPGVAPIAPNGKCLNTYENVGGVPMVSLGQVASGEWIDVMIFIDWLTAAISTSVFSTLANAPGKVPFDETGLVTVENAIRQPLNQGIVNGGISPTAWDNNTNPPTQIGGYYFLIPEFSSIPSSQIAARTLLNMNFLAFLAGAIQFVGVQGNLTYPNA
jgi:hypothetical protein